MRLTLAQLTPALFVGGCSLIYNPSNISKPPGDATDAPTEMTVDAAVDATPLADANFALLSLEKLAPTVVYEGQGTAGSRPAILVVRGHHISPAATITVTPATNITQGTPVFSLNGDFVMIPLTIAQSDAMDTELVALTVAVDQAGATQQTVGGVSLQYLPELTAGGTIATGTLAPLYSKVDTGAVTFTGTAPAIIRAVSSITIGNITANGAPGSGTTGGLGGPGGCDGGNEGTTGGCPGFAGGGLGGAGDNGGGGGGYGETGTAGVGGATGGAEHGSPQIVGYVLASTTSNRSGGGGGGNASTVTDNGGGGGGGGGTVELTAGGNITTGTISADGGRGADGAAVVSAGGGGGGSGGVIVIRTVAGTLAMGAISAAGGAAGADAGGGSAGGTGAVGRIRIDAPGAIPTTNPVAHRGPSFALATPLSVTTVNPMVSLFGTDGDRLDGYVIDHDTTLRLGEPVDQLVANGTVSVTPTLIPGYNKLCFTLEPGTRPSTPVPNSLADACVELAYLP